MHNFNASIDRRHTNSIKYEGMDFMYDTTDMMPFWIADMDLATPQPILDALRQRLEHPILGYTTWKNDAFYEPVKHWYKTRFNTRVINNDLMYSPTVLYTITEAIRALTREGEGVLVNIPSYNAFLTLIEANRRVVVPSPFVFDGDDYKMDFDAFESLCQRADMKVFLLCNPHNPTGKVFTAEELDEMVDICRAHDVFIIADEIHMDFVRNEQGHQSLINWMKPDSKILVTTCLGKTFNISGIPHAFYVTKNRFMKMELTRQMMAAGVGNPSVLALSAIEAGYMHGADWVDAVNDFILQNMRFVEAYVKTYLNDVLTVHVPDATFLLWIDFSKSGYSEDDVQHALQKVGKVALGIGSTYTVEDSTHFRLNVACDHARLEEGMKRIRTAFDWLKER
ncbi:MalY/PatB family protein [Macrococcus carouselicus]|nr:PatB family C-S lyase [Macrococcus carouselicus]